MFRELRATLGYATLIIATLTALPACGLLTDPDDEEADLSGSVSFDYDKVAHDHSISNGHVSISGEFKVVNGVVQGNATAIAIGPQDILAEHDKGTTTDYFYLTLSDTVFGQYYADPNCNPQERLCAYIEIGFDVPNDDDSFDHYLPMNGGYVFVTSTANGRIQGTFTGGVGPASGGLPIYTINNGKFDVPIVDPRKVPGLKSIM